MDQNIGRSFSYFDITLGRTERASFYWVEPGRVLRLERSGGDTFVNLDFTLSPTTGAPEGFTVLEDGGLASAVPATEGATRMTYRFRGDRFEMVQEEQKNGRWRRWGPFGLQYGGSFRSEQAIQQARQERNEMFGMLGALVGGAAAGMQSNGDMASITAGMAVGSSLAASDSEIATAASRNLQVEAQRLEEQRELERRTIAAMNDPNNPLTQQQRRESQAREARNTSERETLQRENRAAEAREAEDREALARGGQTDRTEADARAQRDEEQRAQDRLDRERRQAQQRTRDEERRRQDEAEQQEQERQRREQAQRNADSRRQEQQRQRDVAEAERTRVIEFKEAVVLCELSGPQAQFGNWRCEGPLQMGYANLGQGNYASAFAQMDCSSFRELPRAGAYRAFGCGYGIHPTNPGAARNVPEMLGVFVDGRVTYRCPRNISGVCRTR